jgi:hypothetical protein
MRAASKQARQQDGYEGGLAMNRSRLWIVGLAMLALVLSAAVVQGAQQSAKFAGSWDMTVTSGGGGGGGENRGGGGGAQSLTIAQDGDKYKVTHKTERGEGSFDATVSGNSISWTEERAGRDGNTRKIEYKATVDGDSMKGTMGGGQFSREFTAKRTK